MKRRATERQHTVDWIQLISSTRSKVSRHQPENMSSITSLPPELLLDVFEYLSPEDLLENVQNVCTLWRDLARHSLLWEDFVYRGHEGLCFEEAVSLILKCPMLKHINIYIGGSRQTVGPEELITAVIENCSNVHTFCVEFSEYFLTLPQIDALFEAFPNLEFFKIKVESAYMTLATQTLNRIGKCTNLKKLIVRSESFCDGWLEAIVDGCVSLEYLFLDCPNVLDKDFCYVLENMKDKLSYVRFSKRQPATQLAVYGYSSFTKLEHLDLRHYRVCGQVNFNPLSNIKTLKSLSFTSDSFHLINIESIFDTLFQSPFPYLQDLTIVIYDCYWRRDLLKDICHSYPNLKSLKLIGERGNPEEMSFRDICKLERLESLTYRNSRAISSSHYSIIYIAQCRKLKHLDLKGCSFLRDFNVEHLANCRSLESLNLCHTPITSRSLNLISENLTNLKKLDVRHISVTPQDVRMFTTKMPSTDIRY